MLSILCFVSVNKEEFIRSVYYPPNEKTMNINQLGKEEDVMFSKIKAIVKDYFMVERPDDDYIYFPNEYGSYPFYKLSGSSEDVMREDMSRDTFK